MRSLYLIIGLAVGILCTLRFASGRTNGHAPSADAHEAVTIVSGTVTGNMIVANREVIKFRVADFDQTLLIIPRKRYSLGETTTIELTVYTAVELDGQGIRVYQER